MSFRPRTAANLAAIALVGVFGLTGCRSQPGDRRVVLDLIESLHLPASQEQCMKDKLDGYSNDDLKTIAKDNESLDFSQENYVESGSEQFRQFVGDLRSCVDGESVGTTESTDVGATTEASESTEASETTEATETTAGGDTTEAVDTTEAPETTEG